MERPPSDSGAEPQGVSQGHCTEQKSHAGDREPLGTPSRVAQVRYSDPASCCIMMRDILFEKSPKVAPRAQGPPWSELFVTRQAEPSNADHTADNEHTVGSVRHDGHAQQWSR